MADYKMTLDELRQQLSGLDEYQPEDEAVLRQRAIDIYSPQYQQDLARLRDQIEFQANMQQRNAVKTGMQRSSYNQAQQASIRRGGLQSEANLAGTYQTNIAQTLLNLLEKEKDRKQNADQYRNNLLLKLYELGNSGGGGGGGGKSKANIASPVYVGPYDASRNASSVETMYPQFNTTSQLSGSNGLLSHNFNQLQNNDQQTSGLNPKHRKDNPMIPDINTLMR